MGTQGSALDPTRPFPDTQLMGSHFLIGEMEGHKGQLLPPERFSLSPDLSPGMRENTSDCASVRMSLQPDTLPTKCCSTDTAGEKVEELVSLLLTHFFF